MIRGFVDLSAGVQVLPGYGCTIGLGGKEGHLEFTDESRHW